MSKKEECRIGVGVGVKCITREQSYKVVQYYGDCGIDIRGFSGNGTDCYYEVTKTGEFECTSDLNKYFTSKITFKEFKQLISKPKEEIINNYEIY